MDPQTHTASRIQQQFWLAQQLSPASRAYHIPTRFFITGPLDSQALQRSVDALVGHHGALRTSFAEQGGELVARVQQQAKCTVQRVDLRDTSATERVARYQAEIQRIFDLSQAPLLRVVLFELGEDRHVLSLTMHHIITDLTSKTRMGRELSSLYAAYVDGVADPSSQLPAPGDYSHYVQREAAFVDSPAGSKAKRYFEQAVDRSAAPLALLTDRRRPAVFSPDGSRVRFEVDPTLCHGVNALCEQLTTKPFLIMLTVYAIALGRYSGQSQVHVGVPFPNRQNPDDAATLGCFVNNLPVRVELGEDATFVETLTQVRKTMLRHHRAQGLPLADLVAHLNPARQMDRTPIFQSGFTFEPPMQLELAGTTVRSEKVHAGGSQLDLFLTLWETADGMAGQFEYATSLWNARTIQHLLDSMHTLLQAVVSAPVDQLGHGIPQRASDTTGATTGHSIHALPLVSEKMRRQLASFNDTSKRYGEPVLAHKRFEAQVERSPEQPATVFGDQTLSYRELDRMANAVAGRLAEVGVRPGDTVGLYFERCNELVIAILGTLKAGAAYLPLDPEYPQGRMRAVLEDGSPTAILHGPAIRPDSLLFETLPCIQVDANSTAGADQAPKRSVNVDSPAYVIFTSGSTGRPKGVANSHRGIHNRLMWKQDAFPIDGTDVVLQKTPFTFDVSVWEFLWPLCHGARLVVAPPNAHKDPAQLLALIAQHGVTTLHFVPSMLQLFLDDPHTADPKATACLRRVLASGEALGAELVTRFEQRLACELHNLYGPTEAAVDVTWWRCDRDDARDPVPIGKPIANTQVHILDARGQQVPIGVAGELHIGGVQVALGYVGQPELTAERFIADPQRPGNRLYRTGDLCRFLDDGTVEYLGRLDHQIKLRGLRIELGEIESVLATHDAVKQAVVTAFRFPSGEQNLVAYVVVSDGPGDTQSLPSELQAHLAAQVPAYMVVGHVVLLESLPLTSSGKVDRKALPAPVTPGTGTRTEPSGALERRLEALWCELLGLQWVGTRDNFFELGGNSLLCARMLQALRASEGADLALVALFEHPTIEQLAKHLQGGRHGERGASDDPILLRATARARLRRRALQPLVD